MGVEPRVIGAITATEQTNTLSEPVKGNVGAYVFVVTDIQEAETPQSIEAEKVRAEASSQGMIQRRLFDFLEQMSNVEDLRGKYFLTVTGRFFSGIVPAEKEEGCSLYIPLFYCRYCDGIGGWTSLLKSDKSRFPEFSSVRCSEW